MSKNYLLIYSEQVATEIELLCQNIKASFFTEKTLNKTFDKDGNRKAA